MTRGKDYGGGATVKIVALTDRAAQLVKRKATILGPRYRKEEANATASAIIEASACAIYPTDDMRAAVAWLQEARALCFSEQAQRGLDQLIAGLRASNS